MGTELTQTRWSKCTKHFDEVYLQQIKEGTVTEFSVQIVLEERCEDCNACKHDGEDCDGHRYCEICGSGPLTEGWCFEEDADYRCSKEDCEPKDLWIGNVFCKTSKEAYDASESQGGGICYYTEWEESEFCECPPTCKCRQYLALTEYPIYFDATILHKVVVLGRGKYGALAVINSPKGRLLYDEAIHTVWGSTLEDADPHYLSIGDEVTVDPDAGRITKDEKDE